MNELKVRKAVQLPYGSPGVVRKRHFIYMQLRQLRERAERLQLLVSETF
jgi:hypothetical protein